MAISGKKPPPCTTVQGPPDAARMSHVKLSPGARFTPIGLSLPGARAAFPLPL